MVTSRANPPTGVSARKPSVPDRIDREALDLLERGIGPRLRKEHRQLGRVVRSVVAHQRLNELAARPEKDRRDLLEILEERVASARGHVFPPAVVRLTNTLSAIPLPADPLGRWRTPAVR